MCGSREEDEGRREREYVVAGRMEGGGRGEYVVAERMEDGGRGREYMVAMVVGRGARTCLPSVYEPRIRIVFVMFTSLNHILLYLSYYIYPLFSMFGFNNLALELT